MWGWHTTNHRLGICSYLLVGCTMLKTSTNFIHDEERLSTAFAWWVTRIYIGLLDDEVWKAMAGSLMAAFVSCE